MTITDDCESFSDYHDEFIKDRVKNLKKEKIKRKAEIITLDIDQEKNQKEYFEKIKMTVEKMHKRHSQKDEQTGKTVSFGIIRVANIKPCVELTKHFLTCSWSDGIAIRTMAYHSRQILLMRNKQEKHLDEVLNRKESQNPFKHEIIKDQLSKTLKKDVIYILVATPVEEVGRDHDFDWAVVEPSSYRSIIQLAGRVLRHRDKSINQPNVAIMQYNLKGYLQLNSNKKNPVFCYPGYETNNHILESHDMKEIVNEDELQYSINAIPRINRNKNDKFDYKKRLIDLEHFMIQQALNNPDCKGAEDLEGWLSQYWWLTGLPMKLYRFRNSSKKIIIYRVPKEDCDELSNEEEYKWVDTQNKNVEQLNGLQWDNFSGDKSRYWLPDRKYPQILQEIADERREDIHKASKRYGELLLEDKERTYTYSPDFGLYY